MAVSVQITYECADPDRLATFWAAALGYEKQSPPAGFESWGAFLAAQGEALVRHRATRPGARPRVGNGIAMAASAALGRLLEELDYFGVAAELAGARLARHVGVTEARLALGRLVARDLL